jgi:hypothetical protein
LKTGTGRFLRRADRASQPEKILKVGFPGWQVLQTAGKPRVPIFFPFSDVFHPVEVSFSILQQI